MTAALAGAPARAEDDSPAPQPPQGCSDGAGTLPHGTPIVRPAGLPPLPGGLAQPGMFLCIDGRWIWIGTGGTVIGPGGPIFFEGAPSLTLADPTVAVSEGAAATNSGTFSYAGATPVAFAASIGAVTGHANGTWSWSNSATDGPAQSQSVQVTATADGKVGGTMFDLSVANLAPQVTSVTPDRASALVGEPVTFHATASDASPEDTLAGFAWSFAGAPVGGNAYTTSFSQCGAGTVTASATDKDGGTSDVATSDAVAIVDAGLAPPLRAGTYNVVQAGRVVPVRLEIGCAGIARAGLSPSIQLLSGDADPATAAGDPAQSITTTDASGTDTSNIMRPADGAYVYNLRVPTAPANTLFTVRVRPFGDSTAALYAVLKIRG